MAKGVESFQPTEEQLARAAAIKGPKPIKPGNGKVKLNLPKGYLSNSQVEMYLRCAKQYEFRYVKDVKSPPGVAMTLGTGAHHAVEKTHHHLVDHQVPAPTEAVLDAFSDSFESAAEALPEGVWKTEDKGSIKDMGAKLVTIYNTKFAPLVRPAVAKDGTRGIEKRFSVDIAGIPVIGFIDLIDTNDLNIVSEVERKLLEKNGGQVPLELRTCISDFKTKAKSASESETMGSMQLTLYAYVEGLPMVRYDQLLKQKVPKFKRVYGSRTPQDFAWMKEVYTSVANAISAGVFPPCSPTEWVCSPKWCGMWGRCRGRKR